MISHIRGMVIEKNPVRTVIEANNIGYDIKIPLSTYEKLPSINEEILLYIVMTMSDDEIRLYGFSSQQEKDLFKLLVTVNGIGPKIALSVLSAMSYQNFIKSVQTENDKLLTIVPGLGKKTAQRLILELRDKLDIVSDYVPGMADKNHIVAEAETALLTLGYKLPDIRKTIEHIWEDDKFKSSELLIKMTIQSLYKSKYNKA